MIKIPDMFSEGFERSRKVVAVRRSHVNGFKIV